jgi:hypothetical protein
LLRLEHRSHLLEFQHCVVRSNELADVLERLVEEHMEGCRQVLKRDRLAGLRGVHDGRVEDDVVGEQQGNQSLQWFADASGHEGISNRDAQDAIARDQAR